MADKSWLGFRETLNCGHFKLTEFERRIGQLTACDMCPLTTHNLMAAVRVVVDINPVEAPQEPDSWGPEHWHGA